MMKKHAVSHVFKGKEIVHSEAGARVTKTFETDTLYDPNFMHIISEQQVY
jgi:hypothetical protein